MVAKATIDGPVGVSHSTEAASPPSTERVPMIAATAAMVSGVREKGRAAAAGMINMAVINSAPNVGGK